MSSSNYLLINMLRDRIDDLCTKGQYQEAYEDVNDAIETCSAELSTDNDSICAYALALEIRGDILRELGNHEEALDDYLEALEQLDAQENQFPAIGRINCHLGNIYEMQGHIEHAASCWQTAVTCFEQCNPPMYADMAATMNNLAFLHKDHGQFEDAESYLLKALEIYHTQFGTNDDQTASIANNLGTLYQSADLHDKARGMHIMALDIRYKLFGKMNPDTAQSHNNLAICLAESGDYTAAREHFDTSLSIFESLGSDYTDEYAAVASNYCDYLNLQGDHMMATQISQHANDIINS